jgi:membrane protein
MKHREKGSSIVRFTKRLWQRLNEHDIFTYSASLSYYMLLSFIPLIFISIAIAGEVMGGRREVIEQTIRLAKELFPFMTGRMEENIYGLVEKRRLFVGIGAITLLWTAHMVLAEGEKVIRKVFGVQKKRWLLLSHAIAWGIFLLSVVFFSLSFLFGLYVRLVKENLLPPSLLDIIGPFIDIFLVKYLPAMMVALTVTAAYKFLPQRKVPLSTAFLGGLSFAVLWEIAKKIFFIYAGSARYVSLIYGSLTTLMLFLFFVYYSALIFIVIAEFVACTLDIKKDR